MLPKPAFGTRLISREGTTFGESNAFAALLMAYFRLLTAERIYFSTDAEFVGSKGEFTVRLLHSNMSVRTAPDSQPRIGSIGQLRPPSNRPKARPKTLARATDSGPT